MAEKRAKTTIMIGEEKDKISKLPDSLIIHILSFLSTEDVVSTCLISKQWKFMWYYVPNLSFSNSNLANDPKKFYNYVDNYLEHRKRGMYFVPDSAITSFKLCMDYSYERINEPHLNKWLALIVVMKVKELDLYLKKGKNYHGDMYYYPLPKTLIVHARYLTILKLNSVELDSHYSFSFPSLKTLSLSYVRLVVNDVLDKLLMGSPSLEKLQLYNCCLSNDHHDQLLINIQHSLSLKFLKISLIKDLVEQIKVVSLESLYLLGVSFDKIELSTCKGIRILQLTCCWGVEDSSSFENLISNLPLLEQLTLCNGPKRKLKRVKISNQHLERLFVINRYEDEMTVIIKSASNLRIFSCVGNIKFGL
ncbi:hypothetical protein CsatA_002568 [Cannabis sativa]